jgi:hypothetical protein
MARSPLLLSIFAMLFVFSGCYHTSGAIPHASLRSKCPRSQIKDLSPGYNQTTLDVCGKKERWSHHPFNGYSYDGPGEGSSTENQPVVGMNKAHHLRAIELGNNYPVPCVEHLLLFRFQSGFKVSACLKSKRQPET